MRPAQIQGKVLHHECVGVAVGKWGPVRGHHARISVWYDATHSFSSSCWLESASSGMTLLFRFGNEVQVCWWYIKGIDDSQDSCLAWRFKHTPMYALLCNFETCAGVCVRLILVP